MTERPQLPHYDPNYCLKIAKWTAFICVAVLVFELLVLVIIDLSDSRCPGWILNVGKDSPVSLWLLVGVGSGVPTVWICYVVLRWKHFSQKLYDSIAYRRSSTFSSFGFRGKNDDESHEPNFENIFLLDSNRLFLRVSILWCLFCTVPFWMMLGNCTDLPKLIGIA